MSVMSAAEMVRRVREGAAEGLTLAAERVRAVAVPRTPLEYGDLRSAHTVVPATPDDLGSAVVNDLPYAVKQHEDLTLRHDDGQAKFLESAALDSAREVEQIVAASVRRRLG
ncbi:hypothetical protein GCM10027059_26560 [Myceligenerans halotolerans]